MKRETLLVKKRTFLPQGHLTGCVLTVHEHTETRAYTHTMCTLECETQPAAV